MHDEQSCDPSFELAKAQYFVQPYPLIVKPKKTKPKYLSNSLSAIEQWKKSKRAVQTVKEITSLISPFSRW